MYSAYLARVKDASILAICNFSGISPGIRIVDHKGLRSFCSQPVAMIGEQILWVKMNTSGTQSE